MQKNRKRLFAGVLPLVAMAGLVTAATPAISAESSPRSCSHTWSNKDGDTGRVRSSAPLRQGPHEACGSVAQVHNSSLLAYHCYMTNGVGNTWTHARIQGTNIDGWIYDGNLLDGGSTKPC
ncbi:SH3 domain-containing protein [Streptomyces sp. NPDC047315]|uniref:SH3 domain-containing protein n=1 Tax=Streptomyces sp. NPDC047315 TaxID=3155142 RepID=UPI0033E8D3DD